MCVTCVVSSNTQADIGWCLYSHLKYMIAASSLRERAWLIRDEQLAPLSDLHLDPHLPKISSDKNYLPVPVTLCFASHCANAVILKSSSLCVEHCLWNRVFPFQF